MALEQIVRRIGKQVAATELTSKYFGVNDAEKILKKVGSSVSILNKRLFDWPPFTDEELGQLNHIEVKAILKQIRPLNLIGFDSDSARMAIDILNWLQAADSADHGLLFFYYS